MFPDREVIMDGARYSRNPSVVLREEDEEGALLFDPDTGDVRVLNATALCIWRNCSGSTREQIERALAGEFGPVDPVRLAQDVARFLEEMTASGFLGSPGD